MMKAFLSFLFICLVGANNDKNFIKTTNGSSNINCRNAILFTNHSDYENCNNKSFCDIKKNESVFYVCLKSKFICRLWGKSDLPEKGCFYSQDGKYFVFPKSKKYHILVLRTKVGDGDNYYSSFTPFDCEECGLYLKNKSTFLFKVSNEKKMDFGEFFLENHSTSSQRGKRKVKTILGVFAMILLIIISLVVGFIFYRKRHRKETTTSTNENHRGENKTINSEGIVRGEGIYDSPDIIADNELYQSGNTHYAELFVEFNKQQKGSTDCSRDPGDLSHVQVNGDLYATIEKNEGKWNNNFT